MASIENADAQIVSRTTSHGQANLYINKKQILSATYLRKDVPFYRFIQEPAMMLRPYHIYMECKTGAGRTQQETTLVNTAPGTNEGELQIVPIISSASSTEDFKTELSIKNEIAICNVEREHSAIIQAEMLSLEERKKNWIIRSLPRSTGTKIDLNYVHLQTDKQLRSLSAVYTFVVHGLLPPRQRPRKGKPKNISNPSTSRKFRGDKLLNKIRVGYYNHTTDEILRTQTSQVESHPSNSCPNPMDTGSKKRKREEETAASAGEGLTSSDAGSAQEIYVLYDFEPTIGGIRML